MRARIKGARCICELKFAASSSLFDVTTFQLARPSLMKSNDANLREFAGFIGRSRNRPDELDAVTRLDRLAQSTSDLLNIAERIKEAGAGLRSLAEPWADMTTPAGRMVLTVLRAK